MMTKYTFQNTLAIFNELTGLRQHTGNWPGKTVTNAQGYCTFKEKGYVLVDLPGCYSLMAHSAEEEAARDFICFGQADTVIIVCDATCLERNLNLVLQTIEITSNVVVCVNLMDEAKRKKIKPDLHAISQKLGVPVIGTSARSKIGLDILMQSVNYVIENPEEQKPIKVQYPDYIEHAISVLEPYVKKIYENTINARWLSLMMLDWNESMHGFINNNIEAEIMPDRHFFTLEINGYANNKLNECIAPIINKIKADFACQGITERRIRDDIVSALVDTAQKICRDTIIYENKDYKSGDVKIDSLLSGKWTAFPIMFLALLAIFWLTITGANYPSQLISQFLLWIEDKLLTFFIWMSAPKFLYEMLVLGAYRVLAWVVAVMLPPMAIFFPLFTLLEDMGFLPRIAFNLDKCFKKCGACGKQALTMCMKGINLLTTMFGSPKTEYQRCIVHMVSDLISPYITFLLNFGTNTMWYLQFHFVCDKLFTSILDYLHSVLERLRTSLSLSNGGIFKNLFHSYKPLSPGIAGGLFVQ